MFLLTQQLAFSLIFPLSVSDPKPWELSTFLQLCQPLRGKACWWYVWMRRAGIYGCAPTAWYQVEAKKKLVLILLRYSKGFRDHLWTLDWTIFKSLLVLINYRTNSSWVVAWNIWKKIYRCSYSSLISNVGVYCLLSEILPGRHDLWIMGSIPSWCQTLCHEKPRVFLKEGAFLWFCPSKTREFTNLELN